MRSLRAAAIICGAAATLALGSCSAAPPSSRAALVSAVGTTLPFGARLSGGFAPSTQGPTRAGNLPALSPDTRIAIAELEKRVVANPTPEAQADLGVAYLVQGDIDRAITTIEDAAQQLQSAAPWSDLSAAYLAKAELQPQRRIESLARALEAAEGSLRVSRTTEALFNRALAQDGLAPYTGARALWIDYLDVESDRAWRDTAQRNASSDLPADDIRDRWQVRLRELRHRLVKRDAEFVRETVRLYPEASIEFFEQELLIDFSELPQAQLVATAIHEVTGDVMARDEVTAVARVGAELSRTHAIYAEGLKHYDADDLVAAQRAFASSLAGFTRVDAPYRAWAETHLAGIDWRQRRFEAAQEALIHVEQHARSRRYTTLLSNVLWRRGLAFNRQWRLTEALAAFRESAAGYEAAQEREYTATVHSNLAESLRILGETQESWAFIGRTLEDMSRVRKPQRRYLFLYNAALFAARDNLHSAALLFQDAAVREADKTGPRVLTEATIQRALAKLRLDDKRGARVDFEAAARQVALLPDDAFRAYSNAELNIVRAALDGAAGPAAQHLRDAIEFFGKTEPGRVPGLYLQLARTPQVQASQVDSARALQSGIETLESRQARLSDEALRISYFDESWELFRDMVRLQLAAQNPAAAFAYAERARARTLLAATQRTTAPRTLALPEIQAELRAGTVMVHYSTLGDRVLLWTIARSNARMEQRSIAEPELIRLIEQHRAAIRERRERKAVNDRLYSLLIAPVATQLSSADVIVLVPDGLLQQLPFATLRAPITGRYLIEDHTLMIAPSASFFIDAGARMAGARMPHQSALLIGNPAAVTMRPLPGAEAEVTKVSTLYSRHELLIGRAATKSRFIDRAPAFEVVHFGGHAIVNPEFPLLSRLVFADEAGAEQSLFAHEISRLRFSRTSVVFLAACSTAAGVVSRGEGVVSVARPFLGSGVPLVIASQWDVNDRATEHLTWSFHRALAESQDPVHALNAAQLSMLRSNDILQASPESWGAFVAVGTAALSRNH